MFMFRQASFVLVSIEAFVDTDDRITSIGATPGMTRSISMLNLSVLPVWVDRMHFEWVVSRVVGWVMCVRRSLQLTEYVLTIMVVDVLNGMVSSRVTSMAGTETSVLIMVIDVEVSIEEWVITSLISSTLT